MQLYETIIEVPELIDQLDDNRLVVVDCRYSLDDPESGRRSYTHGHIPTAVYAHLDEDLSGPPNARAGRHPLPDPDALEETFSRLGIDAESQVVAYDDGSGIAASRLWWLLRFVGHQQVAVLNGGLPAWRAAGGTLETGTNVNKRTHFRASPEWNLVVEMGDIASAPLLIDSRVPERYRGEIEPLDPVAGHIPGAVNYEHTSNFGQDGRFLPPEALGERIKAILGATEAAQAVFYCGSGVTACNNLLAMAYAGLGNGKLYAGSWSEWCRDSANPIARATGDDDTLRDGP